MRVFLIACLTVFVLGIGALFVLGSLQKPTGVVYTSSATRIEPDWPWRTPVSSTVPAPQRTSMSMAETSAADCGRAGAWTYVRTDFAGTPTADPVCH